MRTAPLPRRLLALAAALALAASSCLGLPAEPHNPVTLEYPWGRASGNDADEAAILGRMVESSRRALASYEGFVDADLRIHLVDRIGDHEDIAGVRVSIGDDAYVLIERGASNVPQTVAHELVHHYFDELLGLFPGVIEEGTCVHLADRLIPDPAARRRRLMPVALGYLDEFTLQVSGAAAKASLPELLGSAPELEQALELDSNDLFASDRYARNIGYGLGLVLVERIGFAGLGELAARAREGGQTRISTADILAAARLEPPFPAALESAILESLGLDGTRGRRHLNLQITSVEETEP